MIVESAGTKSPLWHSLGTKELEVELETSFAHGLTEREVANRLERFGANIIPDGKSETILSIFIRQFKSPLIYILLVASGIIFALKETTDAIIILVVLLFNAVVGSVQEGRATRTLSALKKFVKTNTTVLRDGKEIIIPDTEIVPGDVMFLIEGEKIAADARIIEANSLAIDESALTGESLPVTKSTSFLEPQKIPLINKKNIAFRGTNIVGGHGKAVVFGTGINSEIGKISQKIAGIDTEIPLRANIRYLSRVIVITVVSLSAFLFLFGIFVNQVPAREMFKTVVSLAVSIIPEGLPIIITLVLATGVWRMAKRNALVKKLQAVEALGQARIIAVDKTGTITKNEMIVRKVYAGGKIFEIGGFGYDPEGDIKFGGKSAVRANHEELILAGKIATLCSDARVIYIEKDKTWKISGDPTEAAMLVFGEKMGFGKDGLAEEMPLLGEIPFNHKIKFHAVSHKNDKKQFITIAGSPEVVINRSKNILELGKISPLTAEKKSSLLKTLHELSSEGLRIIGFAFKEEALRENLILNEKDTENVTFCGFYCIEDSIRPEVRESVDLARSAGVKIVMITGDYKVTAIAIGRQADIYRDGDEVITGEEFEKLTESEIDQKVEKTTIFAQVSPDDKMKIIESYRRRGEIIAMTGDGINDAPSLVAADLGVAMGKIGTEVAKEAADIVLLDDNFGTVVSAIEEGRSIYKTTKKVILYLFSTSLGELLTITVALFIKLPLPILAAQILWLNLVTDGFLDVALAMEPKEKDLLKRTFEHPSKYLIDKLSVKRMVVMAIPMMVGTLYLFTQNYQTDLVKAWTISLTTLAVFQWLNAWNCKSEDRSIFKTNPLENKFLIAATFIVVILQIFALYNPFMQKILHTTPLSLADWVPIILISFSVIVVEEIRKFYSRRKLTPQLT